MLSEFNRENKSYIRKICYKQMKSFGKVSLTSLRLMSTIRSTTASGSQVYDTTRAVNEYLLFHFGDSIDKTLQMPYAFGPHDALNFTSRTALLCSKFRSKAKGKMSRVLDIGCSVGGSSFELTKHFDEVIGLDYSQYFIDAANELKEQGFKSYEILKQGKIFIQCKAEIPLDTDRKRVTFIQGDACHLSPNLGK
jgi:SAM-dependent methyltransferase